MELDFVQLLRSFQTAIQSVPEPVTVSDYVMTHILEPMLRGDMPQFSELDFNAFDEQDLDQLRSLVEYRAHSRYRHISISRKFCETVPASTTYRAFC